MKNLFEVKVEKNINSFQSILIINKYNSLRYILMIIINKYNIL